MFEEQSQEIVVVENAAFDQVPDDADSGGPEGIALIDEARLDDWIRGNPRDAPALLVDLVANLVAASCPTAERRFPRSDSMGQHGLDGILVTPIAVAPCVSEGRSVWEMGAGDDPKTKASEDYEKRTAKEPVEERRASTFIFVTPLSARRVWSEEKQREWIRERKETGAWRDVRVIDGTRLMEWLEQEQGVKLWLAERMGLEADSASTPAHRWRLYSRASEPELPPLCHKVFLVDRDDAITATKELIVGARGFLVFETQYPEELVPFISALVASLSDEAEKTAVLRAIVAHTPQAWAFVTRVRVPHLIIAEFELKPPDATRLLLEARNGKHYWAYTAPPGASPPTGRVILPNPTVHRLAKALVDCGFASQRAHELAKAAGGRPALLLSILAQAPFTPPPAAGAASAALVTAAMLGGWREDKPADLDVATKLSGDAQWLQVIRDQGRQPRTPLRQKAPEWHVSSRHEAWSMLAPRIYDDQLQRFEDLAVAVLREPDPQFELAPEERYAAAVHGKVTKHSAALRKGMAETLALLGARPENLTATSPGAAERTARLAVRGILKEADWQVWASVQEVLPLLAEAAPSEFMDELEKALRATPSPIDELFKQEGAGVFGRSYITGILWGLEALAWEPTHLTRAALLLAELDGHDPGGQWTNRPLNSLSTIFKPWIPRTTATIDQRVASVQAIVNEDPNAGWKLLLQLLPKNHDISSSTHRPEWRNVPGIDDAERTTRADAAKQYAAYSKIALEVARKSVDRLSELAERLEDLPLAEFHAFVDHFEQGALDAFNDEDRYPIWLAIRHVIDRHRRFSDAAWAMLEEALARLDRVASRLEPRAAAVKHRRLFDEREFDLMDHEGSYEEQQRRLEDQRRAALTEVLQAAGEQGVIALAPRVESPAALGWTLGTMTEPHDDAVLPALLIGPDAATQVFARSFVSARAFSKGYAWVDALDRSGWSDEQTAALLRALRFTPETWARAQAFLGAYEGLYWRACDVNAFAAKSGLTEAAEKLLANGRPRAALDCLVALEHHKTPYDRDLAIRVLQSAVSSEEPRGQLDAYHLRELITALQNDATLPEDAVAGIEFQYMVILDHEDKARPITIERKIARDPNFFHDLIKLVYRSKLVAEPRVLTEDERALAQGAYRVLHSWKLLPGTRSDGTIDPAELKKWVDAVKELTTESGHFEVAMMQIGEAFAHAPADSGGFWLDKGVAALLNERDAKPMREGFRTELYNKRGVVGFTADTAGDAEDKLATEYEARAEDTERAGFPRLAIPLRELAEGYRKDAERWRSEDFFG